MTLKISDPLPEWESGSTPIYDIHKSYHENVKNGPIFARLLPERNDNNGYNFLGKTLRSPIGIPAGPLLNSQWIGLAAKLGFDLLTYKTIRSKQHPGHHLPNMIYVKVKNHTAYSTDPPRDMENLTLTNSFGMPSMAKDFLLEDISKAKDSLDDGQQMIVSIVGSICEKRSFLDDFVYTACLAKDAGAKFIEANFSCPNVGKSEGSIYRSPEAVAEFSKKIVQAIAPIPLIIKVGVYPNYAEQKAAFVAAALNGVQAICGLNSLSMQVLHPNNDYALDKNRKISGVCGSAIREKGLQFIRDARKIIDEEQLCLTLMGVGGIVKPEHFSQYFNNGADVAMVATGMMWDPYLACKYHRMKNERKLSSAALCY